MSNKYKYKEGDTIYYDMFGDGKVAGYGVICGCATEEQPTIGRNWIVKVNPPAPYDPNIYPFSCLSIFDCQIKELPKNKNVAISVGT